MNIPRRFEARVRSAPDGIAVRHRDRSLTAQALNQRANRLAHLLRARGIGAESRVAVSLEPSLDIAVALLGILKAGAVYVPLEPTYPEARIDAILEDTQPALVVTQPQLVARLGVDGSRGAWPTLVLETAEGEAELARQPDDDPSVAIAPDQTATLFFTSGTTGKPKGVMASHANVSHYVQVAHDHYGMHESDVMPALARFSFSISIFELVTPLVFGATLLVLDRDHVLDAPRLARTLAEVTFFHAGPSLLRNVLAHVRATYPDFAAFARVRHASSGGDMVPPQVLEDMKAIFANAEVFVIYGCSEISCMGCTWMAPRDRVVTRTAVGKAMRDMQVRLLDADRKRVAPGEVGEVYFAGAGLTKGYWNQPDKTREKFVTIDGERFYGTGDLGRVDEHGDVVLVGRNDFQVKIRGMRVELADVEFNLRSAPFVRDGVVAGQTGASGEKVLVAYVVLQPEAPADERALVTQLRRFMVDRVPDYMVPSVYVRLERIPLNHNMKVDRRALPSLDAVAALAEAAPRGRPPESESERRIASAWERLLGVREATLDDNFFELGGHSLLAMEFIVAMQNELGVTIEGMDVLRESLEVLAATCDRARGAAAPRARGAGAATSRRAEARSEPFHFGPERSLYGVLHARVGAPAEHAVLICAPVGQEYVRAQFVVRRLAQRLAERGTPALRFDYFGCFDSLGDTAHATFERWAADVRSALDVLREKSGAKRVTAVGIRLGAPLAARALRDDDVARLVFWDPVTSGAEHHRESAAMHARLRRAQAHLGWPLRPSGRRRAPDREELLGSTYSAGAIREWIALRLAPRGIATRWLVTTERTRMREAFRVHCERDGGDHDLRELDFDAAWSDPARIEDMLPDVGIASAIAELVEAP